jgi:para-aminobenzoate synthetase component 2
LQEGRLNLSMLIVLDNYDSFVHNLARYMTIAGWDCRVFRNDKILVKDIADMAPAAIILSPGPCGPHDAGISVELIRALGPHVPILGVCLGHQCIGAAYGANVARAARPMHGKSSKIIHNGDPLFEGVPEIFEAGRYHSLIVEFSHPLTPTLAPMGRGSPAGAGEGDKNLPLRIIAQTKSNEIMAIKHEIHPVYGVQFHPESILTPQGMQIIKNFTALARAWNERKIAA